MIKECLLLSKSQVISQGHLKSNLKIFSERKKRGAKLRAESCYCVNVGIHTGKILHAGPGISESTYRRQRSYQEKN